MIFESNPGFIFHDSPGFEAGSALEFNLVQEFIQKHSKAASMNGQLHAIWCVSTCIWTYFLTQNQNVSGRYCIPTSDDRPITAVENKFFDECGTGLGMCHPITTLP